MTAAQVSWIAAAIGLASGSFMLFCSKTADLFGRKLQLLIGLLLLSLFSLLTAFAPDPVSMNVLCGFLGLGTAIIAPPAMGTLFATYPAGIRRNRVTGAMGAANPLGFIFGSMSSGLATKYASWRQSFFVVAVFFFVMAVMAVWTMPSMPRSESSSQLVKDFDYLGTVLAIAGLACVSAALTEAPQAGWHSYKVLVMLFVGAGALTAFTLWEHHAPCPLLPPHIFANSTFTLTITCIGLGYMSFITNQFWISLYMQEIQELEPLSIAIRLMPQAILGIVWSYLGEELISFVSGRFIMAAGGLGYIGGAILILFIKPDTNYWALLFPALCVTLYVSSNLAPSQSSLGAGILQTVLRLSISLGLAITSAIHGALSTTAFGQAHPTYAYARVFLCTIIFASLSLVIIPFLHIGRQGATADDGGEEGFELPSNMGRFQSQGSLSSSVSSRHLGGRWSNGPGGEGGDGWGSGAGGSTWGDVGRYELCLKCGDERPVAGVPHQQHQPRKGLQDSTKHVSFNAGSANHAL
ncbi:MFS general substrate transporter [Diplocarpon rosae]|nr:MFS general substrate transporter [Diplocarpon rosae]